MAVTALTDADFVETLADTPLAIVDFHAGWCGPCIMFKPKFKRISADYEGKVAFFMVDGEANPVARKSVSIDNLPWFGIYRNGTLVAGKSMSKEDAFRAFVDKHVGEGG